MKIGDLEFEDCPADGGFMLRDEHGSSLLYVKHLPPLYGDNPFWHMRLYFPDETVQDQQFRSLEDGVEQCLRTLKTWHLWELGEVERLLHGGET